MTRSFGYLRAGIQAPRVHAESRGDRPSGRDDRTRLSRLHAPGGLVLAARDASEPVNRAALASGPAPAGSRICCRGSQYENVLSVAELPYVDSR